MYFPSIKTLATVFGPNAKQARAILEMNRWQLEQLDAGDARIRECYCAPKTYDIRLHCLNAICDDAYGVEAFQLKDGSYCDYLNTGDTYAPTLMRVHGRYRVASWGDIAERN
jgi:hypothetical protein